MKKRVIKILWIMDLLIYVLFSYAYRTDGLEVQLAKKGSDLHRVYIDNQVTYSNLYYNPISPTLLKIGLAGMIITALIFAFYGTYISRRWILKKYANKTKGTDLKENDKNNKSMKANTPLRKLLSNVILVVIILFLYLFVLHIIQRFIYINFCMLVGE